MAVAQLHAQNIICQWCMRLDPLRNIVTTPLEQLRVTCPHLYLLAKNARWLSEILSRELLSNLWPVPPLCSSVLEDLFFHGDEFL